VHSWNNLQPVSIGYCRLPIVWLTVCHKKDLSLCKWPFNGFYNKEKNITNYRMNSWSISIGYRVRTTKRFKFRRVFKLDTETEIETNSEILRTHVKLNLNFTRPECDYMLVMLNWLRFARTSIARNWMSTSAALNIH
jgi:hypothetical protein